MCGKAFEPVALDIRSLDGGAQPKSEHDQAQVNRGTIWHTTQKSKLIKLVQALDLLCCVCCSETSNFPEGVTKGSSRSWVRSKRERWETGCETVTYTSWASCPLNIRYILTLCFSQLLHAVRSHLPAVL